MGKIPLSRLERAATLGRRSPLFIYMLEPFDELDGVFETAGRPNWKALAVEFDRAGLKDIKGRPPSDSVARNTWIKVRALVARRAASAGNRPIAKVGPRPAATPPEPPPVSDPRASRYTFHPARLIDPEKKD